MIKMKTLSLALVGVIAVSAFASCAKSPLLDPTASGSNSASTSQSTAPAKDPGYYEGDKKVELDNVMTIGDYKVGFDAFRYAFLNVSRSLAAQGDIDEAALKEQVTDYFKEQAAIIKLATQAGVKITDAHKKTIEEDIAIQITMAGSEDAFNTSLKENFLNKDILSNEAETNILFQGYAKHIIDTKYLDETMKNIEENYVHVKHVLITFPDDKSLADVTEEEKKATKQKADDVVAKINGGMSFEDAMKEFGQDPGQPEEGYFFTYGKMVKEFEDKAFALKVGEMSEPVETDYGYHIIKKYEFGTEFEGDTIIQYASTDTQNAIIDSITAEMNATKVEYTKEWDKINSKNIF